MAPRVFDDTGWPNALVEQAWFDREDIEIVLKGHNNIL